MKQRCAAENCLFLAPERALCPFSLSCLQFSCLLKSYRSDCCLTSLSLSADPPRQSPAHIPQALPWPRHPLLTSPRLWCWAWALLLYKVSSSGQSSAAKASLLTCTAKKGLTFICRLPVSSVRSFSLLPPQIFLQDTWCFPGASKFLWHFQLLSRSPWLPQSRSDRCILPSVCFPTWNFSSARFKAVTRSE